MQTLLVEDIALTFLDAYALAAGFGSLVAKIVTAPIDRLARASDVADVLSGRGKLRPTFFRGGCPFSFRDLNHLT
jgi:hypothetical protein